MQAILNVLMIIVVTNLTLKIKVAIIMGKTREPHPNTRSGTTMEKIKEKKETGCKLVLKRKLMSAISVT